MKITIISRKTSDLKIADVDDYFLGVLSYCIKAALENRTSNYVETYGRAALDDLRALCQKLDKLTEGLEL